MLRIKKQIENLKSFDRHIDRHNYIGAGMHLDIICGEPSEESIAITLEFGITSDVEGLQEKIRECLLEQLDYNLRALEREVNELQEFLHLSNTRELKKRLEKRKSERSTVTATDPEKEQSTEEEPF